MGSHHNDQILRVSYEDLLEEDRTIIGKAVDESRDKCLLSYSKTRDNTVIQKVPLPRVLLHGQSDIDEEQGRLIFMETVNKAVHNAMENHNTIFLTTFWNMINMVFKGSPIDQYGPAYFNIAYPTMHGTYQVGTSQQGGVYIEEPNTQTNQSSDTQPQDGATQPKQKQVVASAQVQ
jgi:hypothetical protein